ncbi:MAG: PAS domain-containing protein [Saccharofermentanales bacterium]
MDSSVQSKYSQDLSQYIDELIGGADRTALYKRYADVFKAATPEDVFGAFTGQLAKGRPIGDLISILSKVIKLLAAHMPAFDKKTVAEGSFLSLLASENEALTGKLDRFKEVIITKGTDAALADVAALVEDLASYELHLVKKENILFPMMEKRSPVYEGTSIMWVLHDEIRKCLKESRRIFSESEVDLQAKTAMLGQIYFLFYGLVEKENILLFPAAAGLFSIEEFEEMKKQADGYGYAFGIRPAEASPSGTPEDSVEGTLAGSTSVEYGAEHPEWTYRSPTGSLSYDQLTCILGSLPVDISFVDENNILQYFNNPKERIFPRSPASIGRNVRNCHPPKSYDSVERIIEAFRRGEKDDTSFWISLKGRLVLIQYFALRDAQGQYKGVLEASQDITDIRSLEGEKRLVDF